MDKKVGGYVVPLFMVLMGFVFLTGCPKKMETATGSIGVGTRSGISAPMEKVPGVMMPKIEEAEVSRGGGMEISILQDAFFDFNQYTIREDAKKLLGENVQWSRSNPTTHIQIEGHADDRGTNEYNLTLGEKRAQAAKRYLVSMGVDTDRISIISYGEERPFCKEAREGCYQKNRRAHFVVK